MPNDVVRRPDDLSAEWLTEVLRHAGVAANGATVTGFDATRVGTGQMSQNYRLELTWDGGASDPSTVVIKVASEDETSRSTGVDMGAYEREVRFYQEVAPRVGGPLAACHQAAYDPDEGWFTLVLEDAAPAVQGDQIAGCTVAEARLAMNQLAALHAPVWDDPELGRADWLNQPPLLTQELVGSVLAGFFERYDERLAPEHRGLVERFVPHIDAWLADRRPPFSIQHADYRLDNMLFGLPDSPKPLTVVDWQTVTWGAPLLDAAYFLGNGVELDDRRAHEESLLRDYHRALLGRGIEGFSWEQCWEEYRRQSFWGVLMAVAASMLVVRTERGDDMFMTSLARHSQQVLDLGAEDLLPS